MITVETVQTLNYYTALATVLLLVVSIIVLYDLFTKRKLLSYVEKFGLLIATGITFFGSFMTLIYSEVIGFVPCGFCWFERMMLYPQFILLLVALKYKDAKVARYGIALSVIGFVISLYHHYIQMGGSQLVACPTAGSGADCAKRLVFEFGFVTFPLMATILFGFLIVLYMYILKARNTSFQIID